MRSLLIFICIYLLSFPIYSQWNRTSGPEGISIRTITTIDGILYAGTYTDGLFMSNDDGMTWDAINEGIEYLDVTSVINLKGSLFAGTFGKGVFRSDDNGLTWQAPTTATDIAVVTIVVNDTILFAGSIDEGVYRSSDMGVTWVPVTQGFNSIQAMGVSGGAVFATIFGYTVKTTDNGDTWNYVDELEGAAIWTYYCKDSLIMAGASNEIYKSTDFGISFTVIPLSFPFSLVNINAITQLGSAFFAGTSYDGVYTSTDDGFTWVSANEGMGPKDIRALTVTDNSTLIAGSRYVGVYRSTDTAISWNKSMTGFPAGSTIASMLASNIHVYAGTRDGIYRTSDNGTSWIKLSGDNDTLNYSTVQGLCEKDGVIFAGTRLQFSSSVYKSEDEGITWVSSGSGLPGDLTFITGLTTIGGNILASTDQGVYYSPDDGDSWLQANIPQNYIPSIAAGAFYAYAPMSSYGVFRSSDNGVNWNIALVSPTIDYVEVAAIGNHAFAGSFFAGTRYSSNNGSLWYISDGFPDDASIFAIYPFGEGSVLAGTDLYPDWIYISDDFGVSYSPYSEGLGPNAPTESFTVNDTFMFAGTDYNGVWRRTRPEFVDVSSPDGDLINLHLSQNMPNPFNSYTRIDYSIPEKGYVCLEVINLIGERVDILVGGYQGTGSYSIVFHPKDLAGGIYFCSLRLNGKSVVKKMIHVK